MNAMADKRSSNLAEKVLAWLSAEIRGGRLAPGDRLPTEQELTSTMGVSRTVVREAVAALRADGLVVTRRGSGAYVADNPTASPFRIAASPLGRLGDVLNVMELRLAVEVEAAGFAAERRNRKQVGVVKAALRSIDRALKSGEGAVAEDFAFHRAIAEATGNAQFPRFLAFLGSHVIPRQSVRLSVDTPAERRTYLERIQQEHARIVAGIANGDPVEARRAMRDHLTRSLERYRRLAEGSK
jgi:DNA-binding FadR family transcriptional regulator